MTPQELLATGDLAAALQTQVQRVAERPADASAQLYLMELQAVAGQLRSAARTLRAIASDAPEWPTTRRQFRALLQAESDRRNGERPQLVASAEHAHHRRAALRALVQGDTSAAERCFDRADRTAPTIHGHVDGREFTGLRDSDDRFASVIECFRGSRYLWVPFEAIRGITLLPAQGVLDTIYRPALLHHAAAEAELVRIPMTYPFSHRAGGAFALGQEADWPNVGGWSCGIGARVWMTDEEELLPAETRRWEWSVQSV